LAIRWLFQKKRRRIGNEMSKREGRWGWEKQPIRN